MKEEMIDVEFNLGKDLAREIFSKKKKELVEMLVVAILKSYVQEETIDGNEAEYNGLVRRSNNEIEVLQAKLDKAEAYVEQGRAMIEAVMNRWHEYDE